MSRLALPGESAKTSALKFPANFVECVAPSQMHWSQLAERLALDLPDALGAEQMRAKAAMRQHGSGFRPRQQHRRCQCQGNGAAPVRRHRRQLLTAAIIG